MPLSRGGDPYALDNLVAACRECNEAKGAMTDLEFCHHLGRAER